jgi:nucleoside diphosphate kinase
MLRGFLASHQYTLAVIRPDAYADGKTGEIIDKVSLVSLTTKD